MADTKPAELPANTPVFVVERHDRMVALTVRERVVHPRKKIPAAISSVGGKGSTATMRELAAAILTVCNEIDGEAVVCPVPGPGAQA